MPLLPQENEAALEEARLLARTGAGDREAFRQLYSLYSKPLFSLAVRMVGNFGEAEETLQDAFVKIWNHAASYDPRKSRPFTWAVTVVRRTCIDHLRRRRQVPAAIAHLAETAADPSPGSPVRHEAESHEDAERVHGALEAIPGNQRRALEMALFSGATHAEIARQLGQPVGTVKSWIRRGLLDIRTTLIDPSP